MIERSGAVAGRVPSTVAALVREVTDSLAQRFSVCFVRGELSGYARAGSGHLYFNLKDADGSAALIRCAMFRRSASLLGFTPADGQLVDLRGRLGVYEPRGELQLVVESMQRAGAGALFEQFLQTKLRLEAQGLFDRERKRELPAYPRAIGVVTSPGGAVLHDVVTALARRAPHVSVVVYPSLVQGPAAPDSLRAAIDTASRRGDVDVLIVCRGGGSLEDLWAFNDEQVVRAIVAASMPVISGVGHETDVTLADFAADLRAPTPTAAAELAATPTAVCRQVLASVHERLRRQVHQRADAAAQRLDRIALRLVRPKQRVRQQAHRLDALAARLDAGVARGIASRRAGLTAQWGRLQRAVGMQATLQRQRLMHFDARLRALDPAQVLARGYTWLANGSARPVMSVRQVTVGERLDAVFADGTASVRVEGIETRTASSAAGRRAP